MSWVHYRFWALSKILPEHRTELRWGSKKPWKETANVMACHMSHDQNMVLRCTNTVIMHHSTYSPSVCDLGIRWIRKDEHKVTGAKRREWMGLGVAGMILDDYILIVIVDHSRKFPALNAPVSKKPLKKKHETTKLRCHGALVPRPKGWVRQCTSDATVSASSAQKDQTWLLTRWSSTNNIK